MSKRRKLLLASSLSMILASATRAQESNEDVFRDFMVSIVALKHHSLICSDFVKGHSDTYPQRIDDFLYFIRAYPPKPPRGLIDDFRKRLRGFDKEFARKSCADLLDDGLASYSTQSDRFSKTFAGRFPTPPKLVGYSW